MKIIYYLLFIIASLFTNSAISKVNFKYTNELTGNIEEIEKENKNKNFEYMVGNVSAGTHNFSIYENSKTKNIIGLIGELDNTENNFKLEAEQIPNPVVSSVPEPKIIFMMLLGIILTRTISKHKFKL